ncbi:MAG TPA: Glu-tRNA(Gln) amidotransferase subunit GatE [Bacteroidales bacterium]|nr:Glu-tRNA(Gln) amidotransferase subunit GatE [Bacteroidales bacterium]HPS15789.1 Glu-tRNA(Gln) amidotransferase subunit GatE [Bacteroidales bacterium]
MKKKIDPVKNYNDTREAIGYVPRKQATQETYNRIGFMSGLEVHQQLKTKEKLFCRCPAGCFHENEVYDAEVIRHMRPTLSELGEYDGTALMEFKTRKEIIYRIKNETTCTYEVDDTPPFPLNREALAAAIRISHLSKLKIVGEVHVTRKQYLDGSIPTGFQRTAIIGVEGEFSMKNKKIRLIQLSLEEDACREVSDIRHTRIYKTDRLGMPLIETVTYPDMVNPDEVKEACDYIRFLNRSTGLVRTGIGAGREDVNVSCKGGTRVEIKGVAHTKWIPELTHNECFRQWALLNVRKILNERISDTKNWKISSVELPYTGHKLTAYPPIKAAKANKNKLIAVNLPMFEGILSHFTQPGKMFADDISERLKVIACIERPNMTHSEDIQQLINEKDSDKIKKLLKTSDGDAQIIFWAPEEDIKTALETIEERCRMAFEGIPKETRKSFGDGTTIFERVLPGADRMYPDTDSKPIPLEDAYINKLRQDLPEEVIERYHQLIKWKIPEDTYNYILKRNHYPMIEKIVNELKFDSKFIGTFYGHTLKFIEGHFKPVSTFNYEKIYDMFKYIREQKLDKEIVKKIIPVLYEHPQMDFDSILLSINFTKVSSSDIIALIPFLKEKFKNIRRKNEDHVETKWIMGELRKKAIGNIPFVQLFKEVQ